MRFSDLVVNTIAEHLRTNGVPPLIGVGGDELNGEELSAAQRWISEHPERVLGRFQIALRDSMSQALKKASIDYQAAVKAESAQDKAGKGDLVDQFLQKQEQQRAAVKNPLARGAQ